MIIVSYYKPDRLKFRMLGEFTSLDEALKFSSKHFPTIKSKVQEKLNTIGFWANADGYLILDLYSIVNGSKEKNSTSATLKSWVPGSYQESKIYTEVKSMATLWLRDQKLKMVL